MINQQHKTQACIFIKVFNYLYFKFNKIENIAPNKVVIRFFIYDGWSELFLFLSVFKKILRLLCFNYLMTKIEEKQKC